MKTKFSIILMIMGVFITSSSMSQNVPSYVPNNGLVGWWPFNGNANDESGNGNNGTVNGATSGFDRFGNSNSAFYFDGQDDFIGIPAVQSMLPSNISITAWIKIPIVYNANNPIGRIIRSRFFGYILYYDSISHAINFITYNDAINSPNTCQSNGVQYNDDIWHHVVVTFNGTMNNLFIDGILTSSVPPTDTNIYYQSDGLVVVGKDGNSTNPLTAHYQGWIDDIGIWNRALTQQEITNLYTASNPTSIPIFNCPGAFMSPSLSNGLVGWWPFCGDAEDESGNGNDGTVNGATLTNDRFGNTNSAYEFDGISNHIEVPNSSSLSSMSDITISGWVKIDSFPNSNSILAGIVTKWYGVLNCNQNTDNYAIWISDNQSLVAGSNNYQFYPQTTINSSTNASQWIHFVFVHDAMVGGSLYLNGNMVQNNNLTGVICTSTNPIYMGCDNGLGVLNRFFDGKLDDIGIWNRALDSSEVVQLYQSGISTQTIAGSCDTLIFNANITGFNPVTYANQIKVYPNPASDNLVIDCGSNYTGVNGHFIKITNTLGQVLYNSPINSQVTNIQLVPPQWVNGTYVVQFLNPQGVVLDTKTIIIQ